MLAAMPSSDNRIQVVKDADTVTVHTTEEKMPVNGLATRLPADCTRELLTFLEMPDLIAAMLTSKRDVKEDALCTLAAVRVCELAVEAAETVKRIFILEPAKGLYIPASSTWQEFKNVVEIMHAVGPTCGLKDSEDEIVQRFTYVYKHHYVKRKKTFSGLDTMESTWMATCYYLYH